MTSLINTDPFLATHPASAERTAIQSSLVTVKTEIESLDRREQLIDIRDYGANPIGDRSNSADAVANRTQNSAAIQAVINLLLPGTLPHKYLFIPNKTYFDPSTINWGGGAIDLKIAISGFVYPVPPWTLPTYSYLVGLGGERNIGYQPIGPAATIARPAVSDLTQHVLRTGSPPMYGIHLHGIMVLGYGGPGAKIAGAGIGLQYCGFDTRAVHKVGLELQGIWLTAEYCTFGGVNTINGEPAFSDTGAGLLISNEPGDSGTGGVTLYNCKTGGSAISISETNSAPHRVGAIRIYNYTSEIAERSHIRITAGSRLAKLSIEVGDPADQLGTWRALVHNEGIIDEFDSTDSGGGIAFEGNLPERMYWRGSTPLKWNYDGTSYPRHATIVMQGATETADAFRGAVEAPRALPFELLVAPAQSAWQVQADLTVTPTRDPRGLNAAAHVVMANVAGQRALLFLNDFTLNGVADGDWLIVGVCMRATSPAGLVRTASPAGWHIATNLLDGVAAARGLISQHMKMEDTSWMVVSDMARVGIVSAPVRIDFFVGFSANYSYDLFAPFVLKAPAGTSERDIVAAMHRVPFVAPGTAVGHYRLLADQTFAPGSGATAARPSAVTVGAGAQWHDTTLGTPIWSDGAAWREPADRIFPPIDLTVGRDALATDAGASRLVRSNSESPIVYTILANTINLPVRSVINLQRLGAGAFTVQAGAGVTLRVPGGGAPTIASQYGGAMLLHEPLNTWTLFLGGGGGGGSGIASVSADPAPALGGTLDGNGNAIIDYTQPPVASVTGTLTQSAHGGRPVHITGNVVVPITSGFTCEIRNKDATTRTIAPASNSLIHNGVKLTALATISLPQYRVVVVKSDGTDVWVYGAIA